MDGMVTSELITYVQQVLMTVYLLHATPENTTELQGKAAACSGTVLVVSIARSYLAGAAFLKANCPEAW